MPESLIADPADGSWKTGLPFRPNVGICLFGPGGHVFAGRLTPNPDGWPDPEKTAPGADWSMPQGGIDAGEDLEAAARRELWEETGVTSATLLAIGEPSWTYDFPARGAPSHKLHPFRGQRQRWVAFRFEGSEAEIRVDAAHTDEPAEFLEWAWRPLAMMPSIGLVHRRPVYAEVAALFGRFAAG